MNTFSLKPVGTPYWDIFPFFMKASFIKYLEAFVNSENIIKVLNKSFNWMYSELNVWICALALLTLLTLKSKKAFILSLFILLGHTIFSYFELYPVHSRLVFYWMMILPLCIASFIYFMYDKCIEIKGLFLSKETILEIIFGLCVFSFFVIKLNHLPIHLHFGYLKQALGVIEKDYSVKNRIITQGVSLPQEYLCKYYINNIPCDSIINVKEKDFKIYLEKSVLELVSSNKFNGVWLLPYKKGITKIFKNNKAFDKLPVKLSFCKDLDSQEICLIEKVQKKKIK